MGKWDYREESKRISKSVIASKSTKDLKEAKKFIEKLLELKKSKKLSTTYIKGTKKAIAYNEENKIYVNFNLAGTITGRLSCGAYKAQKSMGVSFHTLPRVTDVNIRDLFVAPPGWKFIAADFKAMELRVLAHIAKEGNMQRAFLGGEDLHTYTARMLFNTKEVTKDQRQIAKTVSFLVVYGGGAFNLSETTGISMARAEKIIAAYEKTFPGIFSYMTFIHDFLKENQYVYTLFGRNRHLLDIKSGDRKTAAKSFRQGLNFTIQSLASDILLCCFVAIYIRFKADNLQAYPVATVHDSLEIVAPPEEVEKVLTIIYDEMVNYPFIKKIFNLTFNIPLEIEVEVGTSFGNGELIHYDKQGIPILKSNKQMA